MGLFVWRFQRAAGGEKCRKPLTCAIRNKTGLEVSARFPSPYVERFGLELPEATRLCRLHVRERARKFFAFFRPRPSVTRNPVK